MLNSGVKLNSTNEQPKNIKASFNSIKKMNQQKTFKITPTIEATAVASKLLKRYVTLRRTKILILLFTYNHKEPNVYTRYIIYTVCIQSKDESVSFIRDKEKDLTKHGRKSSLGFIEAVYQLYEK